MQKESTKQQIRRVFGIRLLGLRIFWNTVFGYRRRYWFYFTLPFMLALIVAWSSSWAPNTSRRCVTSDGESEGVMHFACRLVLELFVRSPADALRLFWNTAFFGIRLSLEYVSWQDQDYYRVGIRLLWNTIFGIPSLEC